MKFGLYSLTLILGLSFSTPPSQAGVLDFASRSKDFIFGNKNAGAAGDCRNILQRISENRRFRNDETWKTRVVTERSPNYLNDLEFLEEAKYAEATLGSVNTRFSKEFDTRFYFTTTAKANKDGTVPMVDPDAKALVVYFHGSGTAKASGVGFAGKMNTLAKLGYSSVSFDLPFHRDGSRNPALAESKAFADYVNKIITSLRQPGQKVILVGHSFGPDAISEYITRHPQGADSAVLISPGSFDKVTEKWYNEKTSKMPFGDVESNDAGGRWAGQVQNGATWKNPKAPGRVDPTVANPKLKVYVISGDREEYVPGELDARGMPTAKPREHNVEESYKQYFKNVDVTIEPGVGHYIFAHQDAQGQDVVLRSVLKANDESLLDEKALKKAVSEKAQTTRSQIDTVANSYAKDLFFKNWLDLESKKSGVSSMELIRKLIAEDDKKAAQKLMTKFATVSKQRTEALNKNIKETKNWAPKFYEENQAAIDQLGTKGTDGTTVQIKYLAFLKTQDPETVAKNAVVTSDVFVVAEKPPGPRPDQQQNRKPTQAAKP